MLARVMDRVARTRVAHIVAAAALMACPSPEGVPEGKLAAVGGVFFGPEDVSAELAQLGAYAQLRFRGEEGKMALLSALVDAELLAQAARKHGLADDPRADFSVLEEEAILERTAELERRVPRERVAADLPALRAYYDAHRGEFTLPERRSAEGVVFRNLAAAVEAQEALATLVVPLERLGEVVTTKPLARDDREYPGFHPALFAPDLAEGDLLPRPVWIGEGLLVGRVHRIELARPESFDDPAVRERLVEAVRAPLVAIALAELELEMRARWPERPGSAQ